jgi:predicted Zn-dependent protease
MKKFLLPFCVCLIFASCSSNPMTGKRTLALVGNSDLFPQSFAAYQQVLDESIIISPDDPYPARAEAAQMVERVGNKISAAAEKWVESIGQPDYLKDYEWEYHLIESNEINAWCMPGGKIAVYTGILPITKDEAGLAVVLGHEVSHALLNHGQQSQSVGVLQQVGATAVGILTANKSETVQASAQTAYGAGSNVGVALPFSRENENEADHYGLILMAIAGYNPEDAVPFWERMAELSGGSSPEFLSTHPSDENRIKNIRGWIPEAEQKAAEINKK